MTAKKWCNTTKKIKKFMKFICTPLKPSNYAPDYCNCYLMVYCSIGSISIHFNISVGWVNHSTGYPGPLGWIE